MREKNLHSHPLIMNSPGPEQSVFATRKYRVSLPYTLLSISPSLAALHTTRFRRLHPETSDVLNCSHCEQCGAYVFDGQGSTLLVRQKRKNKRSKSSSHFQRVSRRTCHVCGFTVDTPISSRATSPARHPLICDPEPTKTDMSSAESHHPSKQDTPSTSQPTPALPLGPQSSGQPPSHNSKKNKTKAARTLQDMLERDRRREEVRKAHDVNESRGGLIAFLQDL